MSAAGNFNTSQFKIIQHVFRNIHIIFKPCLEQVELVFHHPVSNYVIFVSKGEFLHQPPERQSRHPVADKVFIQRQHNFAAKLIKIINARFVKAVTEVFFGKIIHGIEYFQRCRCSKDQAVFQCFYRKTFGVCFDFKKYIHRQIRIDLACKPGHYQTVKLIGRQLQSLIVDQIYKFQPCTAAQNQIFCHFLPYFLCIVPNKG